MQYVLKNEIIWFYDVGVLKNPIDYGEDGLLKQTYSKFLTTTLNKKNQTIDIYQNMNYYVNEWLKYAKEKGIVK